MEATNPALNEETFAQESRFYTGPGAMTLGGTVAKTLALVIVLGTTGALTFTKYNADVAMGSGRPAWFFAALVGGTIAGLVLALVTTFFPKASPITAPMYAAAEGVVLGLISALFEGEFAGIALQAIGLTVGVLVLMLFLYGTRIIPVTDSLAVGIAAATGGIALVYLATMLMGMFGVRVPYIHESGLIGIGFSLFVVGIAALNLLLDFRFIEESTKRRVPKYMEWYAGFGLLVTLVWLYLEVLKLLSKLRSRD